MIDTILENTFELDMMKIDQEYEMESSQLQYEEMKINYLIQEGYTEDIPLYISEGVGRVVGAIIDFFDKIIQKIKDFFIGLKNKIEERMAINTLKKELKWIKENMANIQAINSLGLFDKKDAMKLYDDMIEDCYKMASIVKNTNVKTQRDLNQLKSDFDKLMQKNKSKYGRVLEGTGKYGDIFMDSILEVKESSAILNYTEKEIENYSKNLVALSTNSLELTMKLRKECKSYAELYDKLKDTYFIQYEASNDDKEEKRIEMDEAKTKMNMIKSLASKIITPLISFARNIVTAIASSIKKAITTLKSAIKKKPANE